VIVGYAVLGALLLLGRWIAESLGYGDLASRLPWYLSRAAGITAYLLLSATTVLGLAIATRIADRWLARPTVFALHEHLAWLGLAATGLHLGALLGDSYLPFRLDDLLIPLAAPYRPTAVAMGVIALYLSIVITGSFYVRARLGQRAWRAIHTASFATYVLATGHGVLAGSSTTQPWMQWLYLASGAAVLFLTNYRLLLVRRPSRTTQPRALAGNAAATTR
jgi:predicted ferric reductase